MNVLLNKEYLPNITDHLLDFIMSSLKMQFPLLMNLECSLYLFNEISHDYIQMINVPSAKIFLKNINAYISKLDQNSKKAVKKKRNRIMKVRILFCL